LQGCADLRYVDVVKNAAVLSVPGSGAAHKAAEFTTGQRGGPERSGLPAVTAPGAGADGRTRGRVAQLLLEQGAATAAELGAALGLSPAAIRRHLDAMLADGLVVARERAPRGPRGRGRPAKVFALTDAARESFPHTYDGIATAALRWIAEHGGAEAVAAFAAAQVSVLEERCHAALREAGDDPIARAEALAAALTAEGYAASASTIASGGQLCQHHCPVAHVAAEFPQLCEAETAVISRLVGTHVQRLATIAHGDGVCTTHIPALGRAQHIKITKPAKHTIPVGEDR
jgi:predicted ArsR family transcriptional regulator